MTKLEKVQRIHSVAKRYVESIDTLLNIDLKNEQKSFNAIAEHTEASNKWMNLKSDGGLDARTAVELCDAWLAKHTETEAD